MKMETIAFEAGELTFEEWLEAVGRAAERLIDDYDRRDFSDVSFIEEWENGIEPLDVAFEIAEIAQ
jgi:hypothetical protein